MPDPAAKDPHSLVFDSAGILWFTVQNWNFIGRLDPRTAVIDLKAIADTRLQTIRHCRGFCRRFDPSDLVRPELAKE